MKLLEGTELRRTLGRWWRRPARYRFARSYYAAPLREIRRWLFRSNETTNFTYDLAVLNRGHLAGFVAVVAGIDLESARGYVEEVRADSDLAAHVHELTLHSRFGNVADSTARYGRRMGWYALVRALKPRLVVETGVDKGLGSCVIAAALLRNADEGSPGRYIGTDINPDAGWLFSARYAAAGTILYGDSVESLRGLDEVVDVFINDSDHSAGYEAAEYETVEHLLAPHSVVVADNADVTDELFRFAVRTGRSFLFFREEPVDHWFPGAGIGAAFVPEVARGEAGTPPSPS